MNEELLGIQESEEIKIVYHMNEHMGKAMIDNDRI